jgi:hypothetical protein
LLRFRLRSSMGSVLRAAAIRFQSNQQLTTSSKLLRATR